MCSNAEFLGERLFEDKSHCITTPCKQAVYGGVQVRFWPHTHKCQYCEKSSRTCWADFFICVRGNIGLHCYDSQYAQFLFGIIEKLENVILKCIVFLISTVIPSSLRGPCHSLTCAVAKAQNTPSETQPIGQFDRKRLFSSKIN